MARSIGTIYNEIIAAKSNRVELEDLNSNSSTAIWRLFAYIVATAIFSFETMMDLFKAEVDGIIAATKPGTLLWYRSACLSYRYGVYLVVHNGRISYPVDDTTPPLLAQCSVREVSDGLVIKIAKEDAGNLTPITTDEFNAFAAYLSSIKYAGTPIRIVNASANLLKLYAVIYYDPMIIKASGQSIADNQRVVDNAIYAYLKSLPFDGRLKRSSLTEIIKSVPGVMDAHITVLQHKYHDLAYEDIVVSHVPESGYYKIDNAHPLTQTLSYDPYV